MVVAITGGTGFIGRRLAAALALAGHDVRVLTRKAAPAVQAPEGVVLFSGDLTGEGNLAAFVSDVDVLFHCAGEISQPSRMHDLHVGGTSRLIEAASGNVRHWVQLSSTGAYGPRREGVVLEGDPLRPIGPYETTKVASDELVTRAGQSGAFTFSILRPSVVFGSDMPNQSLFGMLRMIERGMFFFIGRPGASANYIHVDNVVQALIACGFERPAEGRTFNLSDYCTIERFAELSAQCLGVQPPTRRLPEWPVRLGAQLLQKLPGWPLKPSRVDALTSFVRYPSTCIESELHYRHTVSMAEGIADLVRGYRGRKA